MVFIRKVGKSVALVVILLSQFLLLSDSCQAQMAQSTQDKSLPPKVSELSANVIVDPVVTDQSSAANATVTNTPQPDTNVEDDIWHFSASPYLWFPGMHGTVGAFGRESSVHASAGDLLSHFRFGLMGAVEARKKRFLVPLDMMWVRLGDSKALPFPNLPATSADMKGGEFLLTPKIGYRVVDQEKIKVDALTGFRYWHFSQNLQFNPSTLGLNFSSSQNWVDPLVGGRIQGALSPKAVVTVFGDVGGWNTGSQLEYQVGGLLGYDIKPNLRLQVGYRYLDVDYRSSGTVIDVASSGVVFGVTINFK